MTTARPVPPSGAVDFYRDDWSTLGDVSLTVGKSVNTETYTTAAAMHEVVGDDY
jgi:hypothetical protein